MQDLIELLNRSEQAYRSTPGKAWVLLGLARCHSLHRDCWQLDPRAEFAMDLQALRERIRLVKYTMEVSTFAILVATQNAYLFNLDINKIAIPGIPNTSRARVWTGCNSSRPLGQIERFGGECGKATAFHLCA